VAVKSRSSIRRRRRANKTTVEKCEYKKDHFRSFTFLYVVGICKIKGKYIKLLLGYTREMSHRFTWQRPDTIISLMYFTVHVSLKRSSPVAVQVVASDYWNPPLRCWKLELLEDYPYMQQSPVSCKLCQSYQL
jgi:hypothetical protein